jgi:hypothetical protein
MSEPARVSPLSWQWPLLLSFALLASLNLLGRAPLERFVAFGLIIVGGGFLLTGLLLKFVALPRAARNVASDPDRSIAWQRALAGPFAVLGALVAGLGVVLLIVPNDSRTIDITWAVFALPILVVLGAIMARALRTFSVRRLNHR